MLYKIREVDSQRCNGCEKCVQVCHANCFDMVDKNGGVVAEFIHEKDCNACGDCIVVCPVEHSAIVLEPLTNRKGYVKAIDGEKCQACGHCIELCPYKNIEITEENGKIFAKILDPKKCVADGHCTFSCPVDDKIYSKTKC